MVWVKIDCETNRVTYIEMTPEEEERHLSDANNRRINDDIAKKQSSKNQLVKHLSEIKEMKQNKDIFTDDDIAKKQSEIDSCLNVLHSNHVGFPQN